MSTKITDLRGFIVRLWQSCGKPSTKFPHEELVECLFIPCTSYISPLKTPKCSCFIIFIFEILVFSKFQKFWDIMDSTLA